MDPTKEELLHALETMGASLKEQVFQIIEEDREHIKEEKLAEKETEMRVKISKCLEAEHLPWNSDLSGTYYVAGAPLMITVEHSDEFGPLYFVGYYDTDENRAPCGEPLKMRFADTTDDVISWVIEAVSCPFCHSRQLEDTPNGPEIVCANCGNSWR